MGGSLCSANDTQPSFIFEKCQKNVLVHDRIDVIIYVKVPFHSLSLLSFFLSTHPQFVWTRVVWHDLESIGAIKRKWFGRKEGQSNHGVYGRNWYANSFLLLFFFTQNAIEANQKFFCTFQIELFVMIMHNLAILFIAKQYSCFYYSKWVSRNNNRRGSFKSQNDWQYQWREREIALFI